MAYAQKPSLNAYVDVSRKARGLNYGLSLQLYPSLCTQAAETLVSLCICADSPESSLLADAISTKIWWAGLPCMYTTAFRSFSR